MKTSYNWLKQYIDIPWPVDKLAEELTMAGLEVEGISRVGDLPKTVVVAQIVSRRKHPNADKLSICVVDDGTDTPKQIVCGAPNCDAGTKTALAQIGTELTEGFVIEECKIRGEKSFGMLCSERELGLGDDDSGLIALADEAQVGKPLTTLLECDSIVEWEVTPNRPDWLSHLGIAREIAAVSDAAVNFPDATLSENSGSDVADGFNVVVDDPALCPRYTARIIRGVEIKPSPDWMQRALKAIGLRPINNVVDITNFVLMECGQPLHAFDLNKLEGGTIVVRCARPGEIMTALDGQDHELSIDNLVIADAKKNLALGGIIGGANSEISDETRDILLESACFNPTNIRATAKQFGISTDSSYRFERGADMNMVEFASARAAHLICEYAGGTLDSGMIDVRQSGTPAITVSCRYDRIERLLGVTLGKERIQAILIKLGLELTECGDETSTWTIPSFRLDLTREVDLIEEVARIHGLNQIPSGGATIQRCADIAQDAYSLVQTARDQLLSLGFVECMGYTLESQANGLFGQAISVENLIVLKNPLSQESSILRSNLVASIIRSVGHNISHGNANLRVFELGRVFCSATGVPEERNAVCVALTGRKNPERFSEERECLFDYYDLRGVVEDWMELRGIDDVVVERSQGPLFQDGTCGTIMIQGRQIGALGEVRAALIKDIRIKHPLFIASIDLDSLINHQASPLLYRQPPLFPAVSRDVVFSAEEQLEHKMVVDKIKSVGVDCIESIDLIEIYRDEKIIGQNRKSMAYSITFRSPDRTLTDDEVNAAQEQIRLRLIGDLPIQIR